LLSYVFHWSFCEHGCIAGSFSVIVIILTALPLEMSLTLEFQNLVSDFILTTCLHFKRGSHGGPCPWYIPALGGTF
jgi:hypothetical protein